MSRVVSRALLLAAALVAASPAVAQDSAVLPSGLEVTRFDTAVEVQLDGAPWLILRYLAPAIGGGAIDYGRAAPDLELLCRTEGLARAADLKAGSGAEVAEIVVILMDRPVTRGEPTPEATQYIGSFVPEDGGCRWN